MVNVYKLLENAKITLEKNQIKLDERIDFNTKEIDSKIDKTIENLEILNQKFSKCSIYLR